MMSHGPFDVPCWWPLMSFPLTCSFDYCVKAIRNFSTWQMPGNMHHWFCLVTIRTGLGLCRMGIVLAALAFVLSLLYVIALWEATNEIWNFFYCQWNMKLFLLSAAWSIISVFHKEGLWDRQGTNRHGEADGHWMKSAIGWTGIGKAGMVEGWGRDGKFHTTSMNENRYNNYEKLTINQLHFVKQLRWLPQRCPQRKGINIIDCEEWIIS